MPRRSKSTASKLGVLLTGVVWPFFQAHIWPRIQERVIEILTTIIEHLGQMVKDIVEQRARYREQEARIRVEEAESRAAEAQTDVEMARYRAEAATWQQVAASLKHDNERLREELDHAVQTATEAASRQMKDMSIEVQPQQVQLKAGGQTYVLPAPADEQT